MASDTAPAAVPAPASPPGPAPATGPEQPAGGLAGLLSAIEPVRPEPLPFHLPDPATTPHDTAGSGSAGASSSDFDHDPASLTQNTNKTNSSSQETGIWRAWLLAGAERWRKGADARNKTLDIQKAKAQAFKEDRKTSVNRSEKIVGGNTSSGSRTDSGKSSNSKTGNGGGPKGNSGTNGPGSGGRSNGSSRGPAGGSGSSGGAGRSPSGTQRKDTKNTNAGSGSGGGGKGWKDNASHKSPGGGKDVKNNPAGSGGGKGSHVEHKTARETPPARTPKADKNPAAPKPSKTDTAPAKTTPSTSSSGTGKADAGKADASGKAPKAGKETDTCGTASGIDLTKNKKTKDTDSKTPEPASPTRGPVKNPDAKGGTKTPPTLKKDTKDEKGRPDTPKTAPGAGKPGPTGPVINTQPARETGHRDGTRIGKAVSHAEAYKDGFKDGYRDTRTAAAQEKDRLDKTHAARKTPPPPPGPVVPPKPTAPPKPTIPPKPTAPPKTTAPDPDTTTKPDLTKPDPTKPTPKDKPMTAPTTPVQVKSINANTLELGDGATRPTISRGEVRTLKHFERCLEDKTRTLIKAAEITRARHGEAIEYANQAAKLLEDAKAVNGGEKLATSLARLQEAAQLQALKAAETHRRAVRAADNCRALAANVKTRYEPLYQAVVNSPETEPAETNFYLGDHSG